MTTTTQNFADDLPPIPSWDEKGATIDLPLVDQIIDDVLVNWGCEISDYSDPDWPAQLAGMIGPGEAVEYEEIYGMLRDLVQHTLNTATALKDEGAPRLVPSCKVWLIWTCDNTDEHPDIEGNIEEVKQQLTDVPEVGTAICPQCGHDMTLESKVEIH